MGMKSLRDWLKVLESKGLLKTVKREVDREFELSGLGKKADGQFIRPE